MKCYYHSDRDAVGTCKSCGKGLCPECAVDLGKGLACRDRCEVDANAVIELIEQNIRMSPKADQAMNAALGIRARAAMFNLVIGAVFVLWGLTDPDRLIFVVILGGCFWVYATYSLARTRPVGRRKDGATSSNP